jgi:arylsulfatase A-like enzyme
MKRVAALLLLLPLPSLERAAADPRPSFLVVRGDELRAMSVGCYGDPYARTPNIDALAADGVRYLRAIAAEPVCAAHRTSFDLGYYTHATRNGEYLHEDDLTIHRLLDAAGYYTAHVGKWHKTPPYLALPSSPHRVPAEILGGLDYHGGHEETHSPIGFGAIYYENGQPGAKSAQPWRPQKHVKLAKAQIDQAIALQKPFYVVVDLEIPHHPFEHIAGTQWDVFEPGDIPVPPNVPAEDVETAKIDLASYYGMVHSLDDMVGQLVDHLGSSGLLSSTVVIFTSDHGSHLGAHGLTGQDEQKRSPYRESIGVPLIVRSPGGPRGITSNAFFLPVDYSSAILSKAGLSPDPLSHHFAHLDGGRLLMQRDGLHTPDGAWYGFLGSDGMKYARSEDSGPWLLFDTAADPWETTNLIGTGDPREARMETLLREAAAAVGLVIPF